MLCPKCSTKLKCYCSRSLGPSVVIRNYSCLKCATRFISTETLDLEHMEKKGVPRHLLTWLKKYKKKENKMTEEKKRFTFYVAGVQFHELKHCINQIHADDELTLHPDPTNKFDPNAVEIIFEGEESVHMVGFVPAKQDLSAKISSLSEIMELKCTVLEITPTAKTWEQLKVRIEEV